MVAQRSLSSASHNSSAAWFKANSKSSSTPSTLNQSEGAFGSFNIPSAMLEFRKRRPLSQTLRDNGLDLDALNQCADYWEVVREFYAPFDTGPKSGSAEVYLHEMPGGQYTNLKEQAES